MERAFWRDSEQIYNATGGVLLLKKKGVIIVLTDSKLNNTGNWETILPNQFPGFERMLPLKHLLFKGTGVW
jgi:hypothetical protein